MEVHDEFIPEETFREFTERMPEVCVEVILERADGAVLLTRRTNRPARGEWFWPGSRLYKGEWLPDAVRRVGREELGLAIDVEDRLGVYEHRWETSAPGPSRHTINISFRASAAGNDGPLSAADVTLDDQHDEARFVQPAAIDESYHEYIQQYASDLTALREES